MSNPNDSLREHIEKSLERARDYPSDDYEGTADNLMRLIEQYGLEQRIDELEGRLKVQFIPSHWKRLCAETNSWAKYVDRRISELERKKEEHNAD